MYTLQAIWSILTPRQRRAALVLLGLMLVSTALEMLSIGLIVPALAVMTNGSQTISPTVAHWLDWRGNPTTNQLILGSLLMLLGVYAVKSIFLIFAASWEARFITAVQASTSRRLFSLYLSQPWSFHLQRNSAELMRSINDVQGFANVCSTVLMTLSEGFVTIGLVALLLWLEPTGAILVGGVLAAAAWAYNWLTKSRTRRWGNSRLKHAQLLMKEMQHGLGGAKDVKILGCEREFVEQFWIHSDGVARMAARESLIHRLPRQWFELLAIVALLLLAAVMIRQEKPAQALIPMLGLFATVAYRLLPSIDRMTTSIQHLHFHNAMIANLGDELSLEKNFPAAQPARPLDFRAAIAIEAVSFSYTTGHEPALHDVNIRIPHDSSVGFVGGSGAGKSTLIDIILGLLPPTAGCVSVDGVDIQGNLRGWQNLVGYVSQTIYLCDDTIRRNIAFGVPEKEIDDAAVRRALVSAQLDGFVDGLPEGVQTFVGERGVRLSGGQRQRIGIARALYRDPQVLVLDEATSALDSQTEREVMAAVNSLHGAKTLIIVAHRLSTVAECDLLFRLEGGRVIQSGTFAEVTNEA